MLKTINVREEIKKPVVGFGNGSIVYTPKKWIGKTVTVILEEKPLDIKGEVMETLKPYLRSIEGVFLYGSFARNEQTEKSDIDILVILDKKIDLKKKGRLDFLATTKESLIDGMKGDQGLFTHQIIKEAVPILNEPLLRKLKQLEIKPYFKKVLDGTLGAFKNTEQLLKVYRNIGKKYLDSNTIIYSLILRLRGLFLARLFIKKQAFSNKKFKELIKHHGFKEKTTDKLLETYRKERDGRKATHKILLSDAEKLFEAAKTEFLETEELVKK